MFNKVKSAEKNRGDAQKNTPPGLSESTAYKRESQAKKDGTGGASSWYNPHNGMGGTIKIYENELKIISPKRQVRSSPPPKRESKDIHTFSRKSRIRVLHKFNQLQTKVLSQPIFGTSTARHNSLTPEEFQYRFKKIFLPKLAQIIPNLVYAWRLEPHKDGYPHYHWFAWSWDVQRNLNSQYYKRQIRQAWKDSIDDQSIAAGRYSCKITGVSSWRKAMGYVSKYMCKEDDQFGSQIRGRRWAVSTNFPSSPIAEISLSKSHLDKLKRAAKRFCKQKGGHYARAAEFLDNEGDWFLWLSLEEIVQLLSESPGVFVPSQVEFYLQTGSTSPPDDFYPE